MAAALVIPDGSTVIDSADVVLSGSSVMFVMRNFTPDARVAVTVKDENGAYFPIIGELTPSQNPIVLSAPGTYRLSRKAGTCGVFSA